MSLIRSALFGLFVVSSVALGGCSSESEPASASSNEGKVTLAGSLANGSVGTKGFGSVSTNNGSVHISARELHVRGGRGRNIEVTPSADGTFRVDITRGSRWVVTVDDDKGNSALVTFGNRRSAIAVNQNGDYAKVEIGTLRVVGGEAQASIDLDTRWGLEATLSAADEVFEAANGALIAASEAVELAREATEAAERAVALANEAAGQANTAADRAREAAEAANRAAGAAGGAGNDADSED